MALLVFGCKALPTAAYVILLAGPIDKFNASAIAAHYGSVSAGLQTGVLEGESNILFMRAVPESRLGAVLADLNKLMKRGHHLAAFVSDTQVMQREKFDE